MESQRVGHDWAAFTSLSAEGVSPASSGERPWMLLNIPQGTEQRPHPRQRIILPYLVGRSHIRILYTSVAVSRAREMQWISQKGRADLALQSREDEAVKSTCTGQEPPRPRSALEFSAATLAHCPWLSAYPPLHTWWYQRMSRFN